MAQSLIRPTHCYQVSLEEPRPPEKVLGMFGNMAFLDHVISRVSGGTNMFSMHAQLIPHGSGMTLFLPVYEFPKLHFKGLMFALNTFYMDTTSLS